jgi:hypothetical protein
MTMCSFYILLLHQNVYCCKPSLELAQLVRSHRGSCSQGELLLWSASWGCRQSKVPETLSLSNVVTTGLKFFWKAWRYLESLSDVVGTRLIAPLSENIGLYLLPLLLTITALQPCPSVLLMMPFHIPWSMSPPLHCPTMPCLELSTPSGSGLKEIAC